MHYPFSRIGNSFSWNDKLFPPLNNRVDSNELQSDGTNCLDRKNEEPVAIRDPTAQYTTFCIMNIEKKKQREIFCPVELLLFKL